MAKIRMELNNGKHMDIEIFEDHFDMDFAINHHVQNGYNSLLELLGNMGFRYGTYVWDPNYKGLDDYIWECCFQRRRSQ